jgi:hypothetical protein
MSRTVLAPKRVGETADREFDFTSQLAVGETISTQVVTATVYSGTDATPSALINGAATASGAKVTQSITAGTVGVVYALICKITTSASQTLEMAAYLAVVSDLV